MPGLPIVRRSPRTLAPQQTIRPGSLEPAEAAERHDCSAIVLFVPEPFCPRGNTVSDSTVVACPHCNVKIKNDNPKLAGRKVTCPRCHQPFVLPPLAVPQDAPSIPLASDFSETDPLNFLNPTAPAIAPRPTPVPTTATKSRNIFCQNCGSANGVAASRCVACGHPLKAPNVNASSKIPNYLVQSILVTLCWCLPFGIPAIVYAAQVNKKVVAGDVEGATTASKRAKMWLWIAFGSGLLWVFALMILQMLASLAHE